MLPVFALTFALLVVATAGRLRWLRLDDLVFAGLNVGVLAFLVSLLAESTWLMRVATPVLGACILAGLLDRTLALLGASEVDAPEVSPAVT